MQRTIRLLLVAVVTGPGLLASVGVAHATPPPAVKTAAPAAKTGKTHDAGREPEIATPGVTGDYLRRVHSRMHGRYTQEFIRTVASTYPADHPLNDLTRQATVKLTVRWDGTIAESSVKTTSGSPDFDRAALDVARKSAPLPLPPQDVVSDDTYAHVEWTFARDHRACSAGAVITRVDDPLEVSLPRLVGGHRVGEALRRVGESAKTSGDAGLDRFARLYLSRTNPDPLLNVAASVALADTGDRAQAPRLREALASPATAEMAVRGLRKLGIDVCETVRDVMQAGTTLARETAIGATRTVAVMGGDISTCRPGLVAIVSDGRQPTALRLSALDTLVTYAPATARPIVLTAMLDRDPAVRGAATLASVRKGAGRPEMYRLAPLLHDKAVEVRGAASAGMVRAGGDTALDQLYLLARETDALPGTLVAAELAKMSTSASAEFLSKMLKRNNYVVQIAAARALAARKDAAARTALGDVKADPRVPGEVRAIALGQAKEPATAHAQVVAATAAAAVATAPVRKLLKDSRDHEAATWIVEKFETLEPRDAIDVLGVWLLRTPSASASGKGTPTPTPTPSPSPAAVAPSAPAPTTSALAF